MPDPTIVPNNAIAAFESVRAEADALAPVALHLINVHIPTAASIALGAVPRLLALRDRMARLPEFDVRHLDRLGTYALAAWYAHTRALPSGARREALEEAVREGQKQRETLIESARPIVRRGTFDAAAFQEILDGRGPLDLASDLTALAGMYRAAWDALTGRCDVTSEMLDDAESLGSRIFGLQSLVGADDATVADRRADRARVWTLLDVAYEACRRAVAYLRWYEGDAERIAPALRAKDSAVIRAGVRRARAMRAAAAVVPRGVGEGEGGGAGNPGTRGPR